MNSGQPKVLVLGAQGALGRLCVPALRRAGMNVVRAGRRAESASDFRLIDVSDDAAVEQGCADADLVVSMVNDPSHYGYTLEAWARAPIMALNSLGLASKIPLSLLTLGLERQAASTFAKPQAHLCAVLREGRRLETQVVLGEGNFAMSAAAIATYSKVLLDRRADGDSLSGVRGIEDVFRLSEVRDDFEEQGIRIETMA